MRHVNAIVGSLLLALLCWAPAARADVAVLIEITDQSVLLHRVQRASEENLSDREATEQLLRKKAMTKPALTDANDQLMVRWFDADGQLIHHESLRDPRFIHAPGSQERVLALATQLLRGPNAAVLLHVKPKGFTRFIELAL